jgi:hypothetical protein
MSKKTVKCDDCIVKGCPVRGTEAKKDCEWFSVGKYPRETDKQFKEEDMGKYEAKGLRLGELVDRKQESYGDSFHKSGEVMKILYPFGISHDQIPDALAVVRIIDKLFRIATEKDALGENPFKDIAGYGLLGDDE